MCYPSDVIVTCRLQITALDESNEEICEKIQEALNILKEKYGYIEWFVVDKIEEGKLE